MYIRLQHTGVHRASSSDAAPRRASQYATRREERIPAQVRCEFVVQRYHSHPDPQHHGTTFTTQVFLRVTSLLRTADLFTWRPAETALRGAVCSLHYFFVTPPLLPSCCHGNTRWWQQWQEQAHSQGATTATASRG